MTRALSAYQRGTVSPFIALSHLFYQCIYVYVYMYTYYIIAVQL